MLENLLKIILNYETEKIAEGVDFEGSVVMFYTDIRNSMAEIYSPTDFGPKPIIVANSEAMTSDELKTYKKKLESDNRLIKDGYNRIKIKIKELRRGYKNAVDRGGRSGSG